MRLNATSIFNTYGLSQGVGFPMLLFNQVPCLTKIHLKAPSFQCSWATSRTSPHLLGQLDWTSNFTRRPHAFSVALPPISCRRESKRHQGDSCGGFLELDLPGTYLFLKPRLLYLEVLELPAASARQAALHCSRVVSDRKIFMLWPSSLQNWISRVIRNPSSAQHSVRPQHPRGPHQLKTVRSGRESANRAE